MTEKTIIQRLVEERDWALSNRKAKRLSDVRVILGETQRGKSKEVTDEDALKIITKLKKSQEELPTERQDQEFLSLLERYLPKQVDADTIIQWITDNIDFSQLKNKMQAVGLVMKQFGSKADGKTVKEIIASKF